MYDPNRPADELWLEVDLALFQLQVATGYMAQIFKGDGFETGSASWFFQGWINTSLDDVVTKCGRVHTATFKLYHYFN